MILRPSPACGILLPAVPVHAPAFAVPKRILDCSEKPFYPHATPALMTAVNGLPRNGFFAIHIH
jgi:hypothetical protein